MAASEIWKEGLLRSARLHRMCQQNVDALRACSTKEEAIELYKKTIDWALEEDYPSMSVLERDFSDCENYGIYINHHFRGELLDSQQVYVLHNCTGRITVDLNVKERIIPMIYCANGCSLTVERAEHPVQTGICVPVYSFGDNILRTVSDGDTQFKIFEFDVKTM